MLAAARVSPDVVRARRPVCRMATAAVPTLLNLLEPASLIRHFHDHPPEGFSPVPVEGGVPAFSMDFDLLTTLEPAARRRVDALPLARWWQRFLVRSNCFIVPTGSEDAPLTSHTIPEELW